MIGRERCTAALCRLYNPYAFHIQASLDGLNRMSSISRLLHLHREEFDLESRPAAGNAKMYPNAAFRRTANQKAR